MEEKGSVDQLEEADSSITWGCSAGPWLAVSFLQGMISQIKNRERKRGQDSERGNKSHYYSRQSNAAERNFSIFLSCLNNAQVFHGGTLYSWTHNMIFMLPFPSCPGALGKKPMIGTLLTPLAKILSIILIRISHLIFHVILKDTVGVLPRICLSHSGSVAFTFNSS